MQRGSLPHVQGIDVEGNNEYAGWREHRDQNGFVYLSNPITGDRRWLWTRHHDPSTRRDYIYNVATGKRDWVTRANEHLCPRPTTAPQSSRAPASNGAPRGRGRGRGGRGRGAQRGGGRSGSRGGGAGANSAAARLVAAKKQCGPNEYPVRNPAGRLEIRNRATGAVRAIFTPVKGGPPVAALLIQRAYQALAVRRVGLVSELRALANEVANVDKLVAPGTKYDIAELQRISNDARGTRAVKADASTRLLQLGEVITQAMLKVDGFESHGFSIIRNHRKSSVNRLLALTDIVEKTRAKLNESGS